MCCHLILTCKNNFIMNGSLSNHGNWHGSECVCPRSIIIKPCRNFIFRLGSSKFGGGVYFAFTLVQLFVYTYHNWKSEGGLYANVKLHVFLPPDCKIQISLEPLDSQKWFTYQNLHNFTRKTSSV